MRVHIVVSRNDERPLAIHTLRQIAARKRSRRSHFSDSVIVDKDGHVTRQFAGAGVDDDDILKQPARSGRADLYRVLHLRCRGCSNRRQSDSGQYAGGTTS
jgi:hypothetical protein